MRVALHAGVALVLTALTFVGGAAWLLALGFRRRLSPFIAFPAAYAVPWLAATSAAPALGREPLPCQGEPLRMRSAVYCLALRNFVQPDLAEVVRDAATTLAAARPGTVTLALDGGFPFSGLPLPPHLSHGDGAKLDLAFFYATPDGAYRPGTTRSPLGYGAFESQGEEPCRPAWLTLRWDLPWLQRLWPDRRLDAARTAALVRLLVADPRVGKLFMEPGLARFLDLADPKLRFQGCRAARHDDHVHVQL